MDILTTFTSPFFFVSLTARLFETDQSDAVTEMQLNNPLSVSNCSRRNVIVWLRPCPRLTYRLLSNFMRQCRSLSMDYLTVHRPSPTRKISSLILRSIPTSRMTSNFTEKVRNTLCICYVSLYS